MFGRRRHAAVDTQAAAVPPSAKTELTDAQILELVHDRVAELIGENGEWTVSRRSADDTDTIFHSVLAQSVALGITTAIVDARSRLENSETAPALPADPQHRAMTEPIRTIDIGDVDAPGNGSPEEPTAMTWEPAPITVWTDLRKPVTGEIPAVVERPAA